MRSLVWVIALVLLAGACNADDAELRAFADDYRDLTSSYERRLNELQDAEGLGPDADREALIAVYAELLELNEQAQQDYAALNPPAELEPGVDRLVENLGRQVDALQGMLDAAEADDADRLATHMSNLSTLIADWERTNQLVLRRLPG